MLQRFWMPITTQVFPASAPAPEFVLPLSLIVPSRAAPDPSTWCIIPAPRTVAPVRRAIGVIPSAARTRTLHGQAFSERRDSSFVGKTREVCVGLSGGSGFRVYRGKAGASHDLDRDPGLRRPQRHVARSATHRLLIFRALGAGAR